MAIRPPEARVWWNEPVGRDELIWIFVAFVWGLVMFFMMVYWHVVGKQNLSTEAYKIQPSAYLERTEAFAQKHKVREEGDTGIPVVRPPPGSEVYMLARLWEFWPILELQKGQTYRLHLSSLDWQHGFSLQPVGINLQLHPGIEHVLTLTPTSSGTFSVVCNEFCGVGHHTMLGRIHVAEPGKTSQAPAAQTGTQTN